MGRGELRRSGLSFPGKCKHTHSLGGWECGSSESELQLVGRTQEGWGRATPRDTED